MSIAEAAQVAEFPYTLGVDFYGDCSCRYAAVIGHDIYFMLNYGFVVSSGLYEAAPNLTVEGIGIGSSGAQVVAAYPGRTHLNINSEALPRLTVQVAPVLPTNVAISMVVRTENGIIRVVDSGYKFHAKIYNRCV